MIQPASVPAGSASVDLAPSVRPFAVTLCVAERGSVPVALPAFAVRAAARESRTSRCRAMPGTLIAPANMPAVNPLARTPWVTEFRELRTSSSASSTVNPFCPSDQTWPTASPAESWTRSTACRAPRSAAR